MKFVSIIIIVLLTMNVSFASEGISSDSNPMQGMYTWGEGVNSVRLCGAGITYWVSANVNIQKNLQDKHSSLTKKPYEEVYIKFQGTLLDEELFGFAANYDGLMRIRKIILIDKLKPGQCE